MGMQHRRNFEESGALLLVRKLVQPQVCGGVQKEHQVGKPAGVGVAVVVPRPAVSWAAGL